MTGTGQSDRRFNQKLNNCFGLTIAIIAELELRRPVHAKSGVRPALTKLERAWHRCQARTIDALAAALVNRECG